MKILVLIFTAWLIYSLFKMLWSIFTIFLITSGEKNRSFFRGFMVVLEVAPPVIGLFLINYFVRVSDTSVGSVGIITHFLTR